MDSYPNTGYKSLFLNNLSKLNHTTECTNNWCGTRIKAKGNKRAKKYTFSCNKKTLGILKKESNGMKYYESFDEEEQLDLSFFSKDICMFYIMFRYNIYKFD